MKSDLFSLLEDLSQRYLCIVQSLTVMTYVNHIYVSCFCCFFKRLGRYQTQHGSFETNRGLCGHHNHAGCVSVKERSKPSVRKLSIRAHALAARLVLWWLSGPNRPPAYDVTSSSSALTLVKWGPIIGRELCVVHTRLLVSIVWPQRWRSIMQGVYLVVDYTVDIKVSALAWHPDRASGGVEWGLGVDDWRKYTWNNV